MLRVVGQQCCVRLHGPLHVAFTGGLSAVINTEWAEKKIKAVPYVFCDSEEDQYVYTSICGDNWHDGNKNNLRTIEARIVQKLKNNEPRPKFTGSYEKKKRVVV